MQPLLLLKLADKYGEYYMTTIVYYQCPLADLPDSRRNVEMK